MSAPITVLTVSSPRRRVFCQFLTNHNLPSAAKPTPIDKGRGSGKECIISGRILFLFLVIRIAHQTHQIWRRSLQTGGCTERWQPCELSLSQPQSPLSNDETNPCCYSQISRMQHWWACADILRVSNGRGDFPEIQPRAAEEEPREPIGQAAGV